MSDGSSSSSSSSSSGDPPSKKLKVDDPKNIQDAAAALTSMKGKLNSGSNLEAFGVEMESVAGSGEERTDENYPSMAYLAATSGVLQFGVAQQDPALCAVLKGSGGGAQMYSIA